MCFYSNRKEYAMYPLQRDLFRRFALFLIVIFSLVVAPCCICGLFISNSYAAQSNEEAAIAEEEQTASQTTQEGSEAASDTAKDVNTKDIAMSTVSMTSEISEDIYSNQIVNIDISQFSGSASAKIPIEVPPGRLGLAPQLSLTYSNYQGNGWIGMGWNIDLGAIQRSTKHGVNYSASDYVDINNDRSTELVTNSSWGTNYYRAKREGALTKYYFNPTGGWEVTTKDGTKYYYGSTAASRQDSPNGQKVFKWCLDKVQDVHGNYIRIYYIKDQGEIYLDRIDYTGNGTLSPTNYVKFHLEDRTDAPLMFKTNFQVKTSKEAENH
jgi:hypothetical protein